MARFVLSIDFLEFMTYSTLCCKVIHTCFRSWQMALYVTGVSRLTFRSTNTRFECPDQRVSRVDTQLREALEAFERR